MRSRAPSVNVDPDLEAIVRRAMDKDAERRFSNADAMRKAIREWARAWNDNHRSICRF